MSNNGRTTRCPRPPTASFPSLVPHFVAALPAAGELVVVLRRGLAGCATLFNEMKKKDLKRGAHAVTYLAAWWTLFSTFGMFDWFDAHRHVGDPNAIPDFVIWGIHLLLIAVAVYAWRNERAKATIWIGEDDEILDVKPEDINIEGETAKLKQLIVSEAIGTVWLIGFAWASTYFSNPAQSVKWLPGVALLFGGVMLLKVIFGLIKFAVLRHKAQATKR